VKKADVKTRGASRASPTWPRQSAGSRRAERIRADLGLRLACHGVTRRQLIARHPRDARTKSTSTSGRRKQLKRALWLRLGGRACFPRRFDDVPGAYVGKAHSIVERAACSIERLNNIKRHDSET
jgi:hypothetical protein